MPGVNQQCRPPDNWSLISKASARVLEVDQDEDCGRDHAGAGASTTRPVGMVVLSRHAGEKAVTVRGCHR
jgi:hypothetical protein